MTVLTLGMRNHLFRGILIMCDDDEDDDDDNDDNDDFDDSEGQWRWCSLNMCNSLPPLQLKSAQS